MNYSCEFKKIYQTDVLVVGGGPAGFGAAVAAARNGARTMLIEQTSVLGGMATVGLVGPFMTCFDNDVTKQVVMGVFDELCRRTEAKGGAIHPSKVRGMCSHNSYYLGSHECVTPYQSEILALVMDEMVTEAGVQVLFETRLADVLTDGQKITHAVVLMKEGLAAIEAKCFIDCTGDADVAQRAGVPTWTGDKATGISQPTTLFFEVGNIDSKAYCAELEEKKHLLDNHMGNCYSWTVQEAKKNGDWSLDKNELGMYEQNIPGRWKVNTTRMAYVDATNTEQVTAAMMEGRRQVQEVLSFMRKYIPGCEDVQLIQVAPMLGVRESRHIVGKYELTVDDVLHHKIFDDAICTFAYALDKHDSEGGGVTWSLVDRYYTIPYRSLLPEKCGNLLVAGRCICGSSEAAASYRVMPACVATGQAAGTAAAMAVRMDIDPEHVPVDQLRSTLVQQGAVIKES